MLFAPVAQYNELKTKRSGRGRWRIEAKRAELLYCTTIVMSLRTCAQTLELVPEKELVVSDTRYATSSNGSCDSY